tara:strand:- start:67136 stop:67471 length:336 start_codon:yes stop_codon:yes gene_type:complete
MDKYYEAILKPMNACDYTGVETMQSMEMIGEYAIVVYKDNVGNLRGNVVLDGKPVSGVLFDHTGGCRIRHTRNEHQGQRLSKQLFAYMQWKFPKNNLRHSQNMTKAGEMSV